MCKISASDTLKLYRHLFRLCASFSKTETLYFRDAGDNTDVFLRFDMKGAAIRALSKWLRETKTDVSTQVQTETDVPLHNTQLPDMPSSMRLTRSDLLDCVKHNFRSDSSKIKSLNPQQQDVAREMLGFRGLCLGVFLDSQINLHRMSSITTTSFQALLPPEPQTIHADDRPDSSSAGRQTTPVAAETGGADEPASQGGTKDAEHVHTTQPVGQDAGSMRVVGTESDLQRLQQRLDSVRQVYKGRNPLVSSANEFEALCMSALSSGQASTDVHVAAGGAEVGRLVPKAARLRIHAVPFPVRTGDEGEADVVRGSGLDEHMLFHNQVIIENIGETAVQLMGRWHKVTAPWESKAFGDRTQPYGHPSEGVLVMPSETVMEQQSMQIRGTEGEITGGFLCRVLPMDIAQDIAKLYSPMKLKASGPISIQSLDPDAYFLAEFGPCKIRSAQAVEGQFAQKLAAATEDSDDDSEDDSDDQNSEDEQDTMIEVFADK